MAEEKQDEDRGSGGKRRRRTRRAGGRTQKWQGPQGADEHAALSHPVKFTKSFVKDQKYLRICEIDLFSSEQHASIDFCPPSGSLLPGLHCDPPVLGGRVCQAPGFCGPAPPSSPPRLAPALPRSPPQLQPALLWSS